MSGLMAPAKDKNDYTDRYNTPLMPDEEAQFQSWIQEMSQKQGRDFSRDLYDYDLRGFFKSGGAQAANGHFTDKFKKPNHPTFSDQSQYHGKDGYLGGQWSQAPDGSWQFYAGKTNVMSPQELARYFEQVEPGNKVYFNAPLRY